jgi:hypothetical protein
LAGYAVAIADGRCTLIGMGEVLSCELKADDSRHVTWTIKRGEAVVRTAKIELVGPSKIIVNGEDLLPNGQKSTNEQVFEKPPVASKSAK